MRLRSYLELLKPKTGNVDIESCKFLCRSSKTFFLLSKNFLLESGGAKPKFLVTSVSSENIASEKSVILSQKPVDTSFKLIRISFSLFAASFCRVSSICSTSFLGSDSYKTYKTFRHIRIGFSIKLDDFDTEMCSCLPTHAVGKVSAELVSVELFSATQMDSKLAIFRYYFIKLGKFFEHRHFQMVCRARVFVSHQIITNW